MSEDPVMFKLLAAHNTQIRKLKFAASMVFIAGSVIYDLFPNVKAFPALEVFPILSEGDRLNVESELSGTTGLCIRKRLYHTT